MEQEIEIQEGKNIFKYDGPIGRKGFLITFAIVAAYNIICSVAIQLIIAIFELNRYTQIAAIAIYGLCLLLSTYIMVVAYSKRIYDLTGNKKRSLFYAIVFYIASFSMGFIPIIKWFGVALSIGIFGIMLFKKGKFITPDKTVTEE